MVKVKNGKAVGRNDVQMSSLVLHLKTSLGCRSHLSSYYSLDLCSDRKN